MWPSGARTVSRFNATAYSFLKVDRYFLFTFLVIVTSATILQAQSGSLQEPVPPVNIIIDSDMAHSGDDTGDHAMLWAMAARGEANVLALIISSTNDYSAPCARAIANFYGHPNVPIGANKENIPDAYNAYFSPYAQQVAAQFGNPADTRFDYPDAVTVYRQALVGAADHSVYIVSGGYYRPLAELLQSSEDTISPLTGLQLVTQKVVRLVIVAGCFPDCGTEDRGNMLIDPDDGSYVVANWPVELVWMPDTEAWDVITGPASTTDPNTNPVALAYALTCNYGQWCANNSPAWTQLGILYAVRGGLGTNFVAGGRDGSTVVWDSTTSEPGRIIWSQTPDRNQAYLLKNISGDAMTAIINPLVQWIPPTGPITQPPVANSQSVTVSGASAPITLTASDPQGAPLTYQVVTGPSNGVLSGTAPNLAYTPTAGYVGADSFTFIASNGVFNSNTATVSITVTAVQPPTANSQSVTSTNGAAVSITLTATDPNNNPLTYTIVTQPLQGTLTGTPPNVTYTPTPGYTGSDSFTFVANNGFVNSNVATVAIVVTLSTGLQEPVEPVNIIMDSDMAHSVDDVGDHAMLWALAARGEVNVLALILSSTNDYSAPCAHGIASYYGHPNVLIGANKGNIPGTYSATSSAYTQQCTNQFGTPGDTRANYFDAVTVYRQALASAPDDSVYIVNGGFYRPMYDLLQSGPDAISPLTGLQLVTQKVRRAVLAAGRFPDSGSSPEGNLANDPDSASYVVANWPGEIVWLGYDEGWNVITGPANSTDPTTNPIAWAYNLVCQNGTYCANNAPAWTQIAMLYAVRGGFGTNFTTGGLDGSTVVWDSTTATPGRSIWSQVPNRQQSYLQKAISPTDMEAILNPLVQWIPPAASALSGLTLSPTSVTGGTTSTGSVSTYSPAPTAGIQVSLASSNAGVATVPPTVTIPVGSADATFTITTSAVSATTGVTISATYSGTTLNSQLMVQPVALQSQTITFAPLPSRTYGDPPFTVSATASSGLSVSFTVGATDNCTISGTTVTISGAGNCTVTAHQRGNSSYSAAPDVPQTFAIAKATATIQLSGLNATYDSTPKPVTATTTPSELAVSITYNGSTTSPSDAGSYAVVATIIDNNYQGTASGTLVIAAASTTVTLSSSLNPSTYGQSVSFTATVSSTGGTSTGTVTFYDGATVLGTSTLSGGSSVLRTTALSAATHTITAVYGGGNNFQGSTSAPLSQIVNPAPTTTTLTSSPNPSVFAQGVTLTATVSATNSVPSGTVTFYDGTTVLGSSQTAGSGLATFVVTTLVVGSHKLTATYVAIGNWLGSTSAVRTQTVNRASSTTTLTSSLNPASYGQALTFTAQVTTTGTVATGTIQFRDGSTTLATVTLGSTGQATFTTSTLAPGNHTMRAVYSGDGNFQSSTSSSQTQTVNATTTTTLTSSRNPSTRGQTVTFTATVTATAGTPTGTVTFRDGTSSLGSSRLNSAGRASLSTSGLSQGSHSITATYNGATGYLSSVSASLTQQVN
jgi:hypothetical protein